MLKAALSIYMTLESNIVRSMREKLQPREAVNYAMTTPICQNWRKLRQTACGVAGLAPSLKTVATWKEFKLPLAFLHVSANSHPDFVWGKYGGTQTGKRSPINEGSRLRGRQVPEREAPILLRKWSVKQRWSWNIILQATANKNQIGIPSIRDLQVKECNTASSVPTAMLATCRPLKSLWPWGMTWRTSRCLTKV